MQISSRVPPVNSSLSIFRFAAFEEGDRWDAIEAAHPWLATEVRPVRGSRDSLSLIFSHNAQSSDTGRGSLSRS